jgi:hypothetical protein
MRTQRERRFRSVINKTDNEIIDKLTLNTSDSLAEYQKVGFQATALPALSFQEETKTFLLFSSGLAEFAGKSLPIVANRVAFW